MSSSSKDDTSHDSNNNTIDTTVNNSNKNIDKIANNHYQQSLKTSAESQLKSEK